MLQCRSSVTRTCAAALAAAAGVLLIASPSFGQEVRTKVTTRTRVTGDEFRLPAHWDKASDLLGRKVINDSNENLGKIEDIVVDVNSGRILYGVLSFGGFLGVGDKLFAIPWESLQLPSGNEAIVLNVPKDELKNAPGFDKKNWPNFADDQWATTTYTYYHVTPYWKTEHRETRLVTERGPDGRLTYTERWYEPAQNVQKSSDLVGKEVKNRQNEDLGKISDLSIDPESGRILYGILSFRGKYFSIPWPAFDATSNSSYLTVDIAKDQLSDTVSFEKDRWPNFSDERYATETYRYYRVEPYWTTEYKEKIKKDGTIKIKEKKVKH